MDVRERVLAFFAARGLASDGDDVAYLDEGLLDSMGIVMMISEFEEEFGIRFTPDDLQSEEFATVGGLIQTIERARAAA